MHASYFNFWVVRNPQAQLHQCTVESFIFWNLAFTQKLVDVWMLYFGWPLVPPAGVGGDVYAITSWMYTMRCACTSTSSSVHQGQFLYVFMCKVYFSIALLYYKASCEIHCLYNIMYNIYLKVAICQFSFIYKLFKL